MKIPKTLLAGTILLLQACTQPVEKNSKDPESRARTSDLSLKSIQIALKPNKDVQGQREDEKLLGEELTKRLGIPVKITTPSSKAIIEAGLANKTIDLGYVSSGDAISFADNDVAEVLVAGQHESIDIDGNPYKGAYYYSVWLSLKDKPYAQISDLKNKPVAFASRTSTSGLLVPSWDLIKRGLVEEGGSLTDFFGEGNVFYGTGYVSAVEQVLEGTECLRAPHPSLARNGGCCEAQLVLKTGPRRSALDGGSVGAISNLPGILGYLVLGMLGAISR